MNKFELKESNLPLKIILPPETDLKIGFENDDITKGKHIIITSYNSMRKLQERSIKPTDNLNTK